MKTNALELLGNQLGLLFKRGRRKLASHLLGWVVPCLLLLAPQLASAVTATWTASSGQFNVAKNWSTGKVPGPSDTAVISSGTFSFSTSGTITAGTVMVSIPYTISSSETLSITGNWTFSNTFAVPSGNQFSITGGGAVTVTGTTTVNAGNLYVYGGSSLTLSALTSYTSPSNGDSVEWYVEGTGSQLNFPALKTVTGTTYSGEQSLTLSAADGGTFSLPVLTSITQSDAHGYSEGYVYFVASGGGAISAPQLASFEDNGSDPQSELYDDSSSSIYAPKLTTVVGVELDIDDSSILGALTSITGGNLSIASGTVSLANLTSLGAPVAVSGGAQVSFPKVTGESGTITLSVQDNGGQGTELSFPALTTITGTVSLQGNGGTMNFPVLTSIANGTISAQNGSTFSFPDLTSASGLSSIYVYSGTVVSFPAVTSYTSPSNGNSDTWYVNGAGAELNFPALKTVTGTTYSEEQSLTLSAADGGTFSLPVLTSITQSDANGYIEGYVYFVASGGGTISAPQLASFEDNGSDPQSELYDDSASSIYVPKLTTVVGLELDIDDASTLAQLSSITASTLSVNAGTVSLSSLNSIAGLSSISISGGAQVSFPEVTGESGTTTLTTQDSGGQGTELNFPALTTITGTVSIQGYGGAMNFPVLTSIANGSLNAQDGTVFSFPDLTSVSGLSSINVYSGTVVSFPAVTGFTSPSNGISDNWYVYGAGAELNFPALKTITGTTYAGVQSLGLNANSSGLINLPALTSITQSDANGYIEGYVYFGASGGGTISAPQLASFEDNGSDPQSELYDDSTSSIYVPKLTTVVGLELDIDDASTLAQLSSITASTLSVNAGTVSLSSLNSIAGLSSISISGGAQVSFPEVTGESGTTTLTTQDSGGQGTELNFPALTTITGTVSIQGYGGAMNFPVLTSIANGSLNAQDGTVFSFPDLTSVSGLSSINVYSGTVVSFPAVTSYTSPSNGNSDTWSVNGAGAELNFPALKTITGTTYAYGQGLSLYAGSGGTLNLPVLTSITQSDADGYSEGDVYLDANGGTISAPLLASFQDNGANPESSLTLSGAKSYLYIPDLMSTGVKNVTKTGISQGTQTLAAFATIPTQMYGTPYTVTPPVASSKYPVTITVVSGPATISGYKLTFTGLGTVMLAANQPGNLLYKAATQVTTSFSVVAGSQTITFPTVPNQMYGAAPFTVNPTASSGLAVTITVQSGPATISGNTVTLTGVGTVVLAANQPGNTDYNPAPQVMTSFTVSQGSQTISPFATIPTQTYGESPFTITPPTASSGLAVTVTGQAGSPATISGNTVTITGAGTVVLLADQAGNANYSAAPEVMTSFAVSQESQTISAFATIPTQTYGEAPFTITPPTASSGLPVTVTVKSGPATISGNTVTLTASGTVVLAADQAGNANYSAAPEVTTSFVVNPSSGKSSQTISPFATIPTQTYGEAPFTITIPTASSGLPVTVKVKTGPATFSGDTVTITGVGTVTLSANQAGNANYTAAPQVTTSFTVSKASQTISAFATIPTQTYGEAPFTITPPTASSGLAVTVKVKSGPATISGNTVTITGVGTVVLSATQAGNSDYAAAPVVTTSFTVAKAGQTITFPAVGAVSVNQTVTLAATSTSGLAITYKVVATSGYTGAATINGSSCTFTAAGKVKLAANQAGNADYKPATQVVQTVTVSP